MFCNSQLVDSNTGLYNSLPGGILPKAGRTSIVSPMRMYVHAGKCKEFLQASVCKDVEAGEGQVAECISDVIAAAESGDTQDAGMPSSLLIL